ncbi:hypothetical protein Egran_02410 [Elaphomyces granulatus]|uniref:U4/U6 snRNA-associated-splicing factor PRP24 n=1 Tax=Elaphomyces granulatus TaxID=519963 RepID=A0A232M150_9EURO|nr:hypothetical protein Egran_02410 [Elaphomyces granulatus]
MDINSLLSPQESATQSRQSTATQAPLSIASPTPTPNVSSHKTIRRTRSGSARQGMTSSPLAQHVFASSRLPDQSPPTMSPPNGPNRAGGSGTPPVNDLPQPPPRQPSTPGIDTLAGLASLQHHQLQRSSLRTAEPYESQLSPPTLYSNAPPIPRNTPTPRSSFDLAMSEASRDTLKRNYADSSLAADAQQLATQLATRIQEYPHAYEAHVQFIQLLHAGFMNHVYPPHTPDKHGDPQKYDLLKDLRSAREEMDRLFAVGEDLWADWIQDESMLARTVEERIAVMELCRRAVEEEYGSAKLWAIFGEWMLYLYYAATGESSQSQWSEEDRLVGREVFSWQSVVEVWQKGAEATRWRINDSNRIWDRLLELSVQDLARASSAERVAQTRALFEGRLQTPHATWDQTFQLFSGFISTYYNAKYEDIMADTVARASETKAKYNMREELERRLQRTVDSGDRDQEWSVFSEYIEWETSRNRRKGLFSFDLVNAVYQRATLRFSFVAKLWEDYITFITDESMRLATTPSAVPTLERATRHCPWSGSLWSQYLLSSEREGQSFSKIADIKHKATCTGLLDAGGMEEVLKVHTAWCSYLRRRAFLPDSTDEDLDVAEVGIRSAIESVQELGEKKCGKSYQGDPMFRLERIYIRYLSERGSWDSARETFKSLVSRRGGGSEFWLTYYFWELLSWSRFVQGEATADAARRTSNPSYATAVLKQAIKRRDLDCPDKIMTTYITHCEDFEDSDELQIAMIETHKAQKAIDRKKEKDALAAQTIKLESASQHENGVSISKRKREDETTDINGVSTKKARSEDAISDQTSAKRDRENATVYVKNLPKSFSEVRVRQFFRDCGTINSLKLLTPDDDSVSALIEFDSKEDAIVAQTRDRKVVDEHIIEVQIGSGSTLYVANFPRTADEAYIRGIFSEACRLSFQFGEVVDVRFPSLKYNTRRRFCYVQFLSASAARAATRLDGMTVGDDLHLVVQISDPSQKRERSGPVYEEREIHVSNLHWKATESDLQVLFSQYGKVEVARIPTKVDGGSKGFGFVVFSSKEEANAALEMDQKDFRSRPLHVKLSTPTGPKRQATTIVSRVGKSPSVEPNGVSPSSSWASELSHTAGPRAARTLGLMNIPDTINDTRIRSIVESFGSIVKIILRPDHQGAIVEFADVNDAGRASLELEGYEIATGKKIHVGSASEMMRQHAEHKTDRIQVGKQKDKTPMLIQPAVIKRPAQPGTRAGRRGAFGLKRGGGPTATHQDHRLEARNTGATAEHEKVTKTNDDFRAMIQRSAQ